MGKQKDLTVIIIKSLGLVVLVACLVFGLAWGIVKIAHFREKHSGKEIPPQLTASRPDLPEPFSSLSVALPCQANRDALHDNERHNPTFGGISQSLHEH